MEDRVWDALFKYGALVVVGLAFCAGLIVGLIL